MPKLLAWQRNKIADNNRQRDTKRTMNRYKNFTFILILLFLLSTVVAVSHHHEKAATDHECTICIASDDLSSTGLSTTAFDITPCLTETTVVISAPALTEYLLVDSFSTRGPLA